MPDLPIGDEEGNLSTGSDSMRVYAFMAHPRSEEFRQQYLARMYEVCAADLQVELEARVPKEAPPHLVSAVVGVQLGRWIHPLGGFPRLASAPSANDAAERLFDNAWPGSVAGDLLLYLHQMRLSGIEPSVNKAVTLEVDYLAGATTVAGAPSQGGSARYVRDQWAEFKPVVHLWAAYRTTFFANQNGRNVPEPTSDEGFPLFLALSEWWADEALGIQGRQPILDNAELWRVPARVRSKWPLLQITTDSPLPDWALEVLRRHYKSLRK
jgi:hypothetical protein